MKQFKAIFCGTPDFSVPTLTMLSKHPLINLCGVITMPDRKSGRGQELHSPPVALFAKENSLPLYQTENLNRDPELIHKIKNEKIDLLIVLAFAQFLGKEWLGISRLGAFNIHTSLLPKYRGAAPIQYALLNGDPETGVSIQKMVSKMDAGNIVKEKLVPIGPKETGGELYDRLKIEAATTCSEFINDLSTGNILERVQDEALVSFAPTLKKEDGLLNFKEQTTTMLLNRVRALKPWPGTFTFISGKRTKIIDIEASVHKLAAGKLEVIHGALNIGTKDGAIRVLTLQLEGKGVVSDREFLNGIKNQNIVLTLDSP